MKKISLITITSLIVLVLSSMYIDAFALGNGVYSLNHRDNVTSFDIKYYYYLKKSDNCDEIASCNGSPKKECSDFTSSNINLSSKQASSFSVYYNKKWIFPEERGAVVYCLDPILSTPTQVQVAREMNPYGGNWPTFDAAALYVMNYTDNSINKEKLDALKEQALRILAWAWNYESTAKQTTCLYEYVYEAWGLANAYGKTAYDWLKNNNNYKTKLEKDPNKIVYNRYYNNSNATGWALYGSDLSYVKTNLVEPAVAQAAKFTKDYRDSHKVVMARTGRSNEMKNGTTRTITDTISISHRPTSTGFLKINSLTSSNSNVSAKLLINGSTYDAVSVNNILVSTDTFRVQLSTTATGRVQSDYTLRYTYCYDNTCKTGYVLYGTGSGSTNTQRMLVLDNSSTYGSDESKGFSGSFSDTVVFEKETCETTISLKTECDGGDEGLNKVGYIATNNDINSCIINNEDEAGNSYRVNQAFSGVYATNEACEVYCKEDFDVHFDGVKHVNSGRYFKIGAQITDKISCYVTNIDYNASADKVNECLNAPLYMYNAYANHKKDETVSPISGVSSYSSGAMTFEFLRTDVNREELLYSYEDPIFEHSLSGGITMRAMSKVLKNDNVNFEINGCRNVDSSFNCTAPASAINYSDMAGYKNTGINSMKNNRLKNLIINITATASYTTVNQYYNQYPTGTIQYSAGKNSSSIDGLPVKITTDTGLYKYIFKLQNLGNFYTWRGDGVYYGRLIGGNKNQNSVVKKQGDASFTGSYMCYYIINCPDCEPVCEMEGSTGTKICKPVPKCPECDHIIELYSKKLNVEFRPVSSFNINPNDRKLGYNWNYNTFSYLIGAEYATLKANATVKEIEEDGDKVYNEDPILSVQMTPQLAGEIRRYNARENTYSNDTLTCYDYYKMNGSSVEKVYENVMCYSDYLDSLLTNSTYKSNFKAISSRTPLSSRSAKTESVNKLLSSSNYWSFFNNDDVSYLKDLSDRFPKVNITTSFVYGGANNESVGGPSWK